MVKPAYQLLIIASVASIIGNQWTTAATIGLYHGTIGYKQNRCLHLQNRTQHLVHATLESNTINETLFFVEATDRSKTNPKRKFRNKARQNSYLSRRFFFGLANERIDTEMSLIPDINHGGFLISLTCRHRFAKNRVLVVFEAAVESYHSPDNCLYPVTKQTEFTIGGSKTTDRTHPVSIKGSRRDSTIKDTNPSLDLDFDREKHQGQNTDSANPKFIKEFKTGKTMQRKRRETSERDDSKLYRPRRNVNLEPETRGPFYIKLFILMDTKLYDMYDGNRDSKVFKARIQKIVDYANTVYRKYNIRMSIGKFLDPPTDHQVLFTSNSGDYLSRISLYFASTRKDKSLKEIDHLHFFTGHHFDDDVIGKAYYRSMCAPSTSVSFSSDSPHWDVQRTASIFVHEIGHSLGMVHDDPTNCVCKHSRGCIMASYIITPAPRYFSDCSEDGLFKYLDSWRSQCLRGNGSSVPEQRLVPRPKPVCGDGKLDKNEECDCGMPGFCMNPCCNPYTCKLTKGSECYEGGCCKHCKLKTKGTVCRQSFDDCDLPDMCDGQSPICSNLYKEDGTACIYSGICRGGKCKSRTVQCERLFGKGTMNGPYTCYTRINKVGKDFGNCGKQGSVYKACSQVDAECGKLQCKSPTVNVMPINGWRTGYVELNLKYGSGKCKSASFGYGGLGEGDPTMVLDYTPCGKGKHCLNRRCRNTNEVFNSLCSKCPSTRGWCTNKGMCQCNPEWDGLNCQLTIREAKLKAEEDFRIRKAMEKLNQTIPQGNQNKNPFSSINAANQAKVATDDKRKQEDQAKAKADAEARRKQTLRKQVSRGKKTFEVVTVVNGEGRMYIPSHFVVLLLPLFTTLIQCLFS